MTDFLWFSGALLVLVAASALRPESPKFANCVAPAGQQERSVLECRAPETAP